MKITVMNRVDAANFCSNEHSFKTAVISITTPGDISIDTEIKLDNSIVDILNISFFDTDKSTDEGGAMDDITAYKITQFVKKHAEMLNTEHLLVHCDAGRSRSAGIAAAILKYLYNDDTPIFSNIKYNPNMLCYRKTLNALYKNELDIPYEISLLNMCDLDKANILFKMLEKIELANTTVDKGKIQKYINLYEDLMADTEEKLIELKAYVYN